MKTANNRNGTPIRCAVAALLIVFGIPAVSFSPVVLVFANGTPLESGGGVNAWRILGTVLMAVGGLLWIASGITCWRGRRLTTVSGAAFGLLSFGFGRVLFSDVDL